MSLLLLQEEIYRVNVANGWFDPEKPRSYADDVALIHSEISEAFEAYRDWGMEDKTGDPKEGQTLAKPEGVGSELADVLVRVLDTAKRYEISGESFDTVLKDANTELEESDYEVLHAMESVSFGTLVSYLHKMTSFLVDDSSEAPDREDLEDRLLDVFSAIYLVSKLVDIDLITETERKVAFNATRGYRHGGKLV